jgi:DNA-binding transcriptional LysR family regulator
MQYIERARRHIKLRDLHILLVVARRGSMAKAAVELAISQPAVSRAIADMERALGLRLLDRGRNGIEPTPYGRALVKRGVTVFDELTQRPARARISFRSGRWRAAYRHLRERCGRSAPGRD